MTTETLYRKLRKIEKRGDGDPEMNHSDADDVLCEFIAQHGPMGARAVNSYNRITKWYS